MQGSSVPDDWKTEKDVGVSGMVTLSIEVGWRYILAILVDSPPFFPCYYMLIVRHT